MVLLVWDSATSDVDARYTLPFINHLARDKMKNDNRQRQTIAFEEYTDAHGSRQPTPKNRKAFYGLINTYEVERDADKWEINW